MVKGVAQHHTLHPASCLFALICLFAVLEVGKILLRERAGQKPREQQVVIRVWKGFAPRPHLPLHPDPSPARETALSSAPEQKVSLAKGWYVCFLLNFLWRDGVVKDKLLFVDIFLERFFLFPPRSEHTLAQRRAAGFSFG